jgi:predicted RNA-binding protein
VNKPANGESANERKVEMVPEGVRLSKLFEAPRVVPATIREIDLVKHRVLLDALSEPEGES